MPALTAEAQQRQARHRAAAAPARAGGRADSYTDRTLLERCITRGSPARRCRRSTTTTFASARRRATSRSSTRWCTRRASCRSTTARSATCAATWESRAAGGKATRWSSRRATSTAGRRFAAPATNLRVIERYTRSAADKIDFKVTFEDDTHVDAAVDGGATRCARPKASCTSTHATKATMGCATSSRTRATRSARPRREARR